jgi:hypothetical protein
MEEKKCPVLVDGEECGLTLTKIDWETDLGIYECALEHYSYFWQVEKTLKSA